MQNIKLIADNFNQIYNELYNEIKKQPITVVRGLKTKELVDCKILLSNPFACFVECDNEKYYKYFSNELMLYLSGTCIGSNFVDISKFWSNCLNNDNTVNSNYGYHIFYESTKEKISQFYWCFNELKKDINTRKAVINFNSISHKGDNDLPCTISLQFLVRNNILDVFVNMRSNDLIYGLRYDLPFFCIIQIMMFLMLKNIYPEIAIGNYTHNSVSMHIYERHF